jgi:hypothetical protein
VCVRIQDPYIVQEMYRVLSHRHQHTYECPEAHEPRSPDVQASTQVETHGDNRTTRNEGSLSIAPQKVGETRALARGGQGRGPYPFWCIFAPVTCLCNINAHFSSHFSGRRRPHTLPTPLTGCLVAVPRAQVREGHIIIHENDEFGTTCNIRRQEACKS